MMPRHVFIVVTHLLGVGHFARMAALGRALAQAGMRVTLVSGGRANATIETGGLALVQLPAVHCRNGDFSRVLDDSGEVMRPETLAERARLLLEAYEHAQPDCVITELYPFGRRALAAEFEALLARITASRPRPLLLCSIRDVLNPPAKPGRAESVLGRLAAYDGVLVHGDDTVPLDRSWPVTPDLARQIHYAGYLRDATRDAAETMPDTARCGILVSGGGSDAGLALAEAALAAALRLPDEPWHILVSHAIAVERLAAMQASAPPHVTVEPARRDFPALLARCRVSVSQAGYNTMLDLAAAGPRAVLVPFAAGQEREQTLRAEAIAARGLARIVPETELTGETLANAIRSLGAEAAPDWSGIRLDGAERAVATIRALALSHTANETAWAGLDALLDAMAEAGDRIDLWLRDDDVVAVTPALERFLAQLARHAIPAGFAAIPTRLEPGLAERFAAEPLTHHLLVHGHRHQNHAPAGQRAAEFGAHRDPEVIAGELADSLSLTQHAFGARALPVFVPPWNRIDEAVARRLPALGYAGLSTFAERREAGDPPGFVQANCHWDPIDWKGTRGLKAPAKLIAELGALIATERAKPAEARRPIGLLTHHLVHDGWMEGFLERLFTRLAGSGAIRFLSPAAVFAVPQSLRKR